MDHRRHEGRAIREVIMNHPGTGRPKATRAGFGSNKYVPSGSRDLVHVLALELPRLSM